MPTIALINFLVIAFCLSLDIMFPLSGTIFLVTMFLLISVAAISCSLILHSNCNIECLKNGLPGSAEFTAKKKALEKKHHRGLLCILLIAILVYCIPLFIQLKEDKIKNLMNTGYALINAMFTMRMDLDTEQLLHCKDGKYTENNSQKKLSTDSVQLRIAATQFEHVLGSNNPIQLKINEFISISKSNVDRICQTGSATNKELKLLENQIDVFINNLIDASLK